MTTHSVSKMAHNIFGHNFAKNYKTQSTYDIH